MSVSLENNILPDSFIALMKESLGIDAVNALFARLCKRDRLTSIRINPFKIGERVTVNSILRELECSSSKSNGLDNINGSSDVKWGKLSYYLDERPKFTLDPLFHAGAYYVQEASSIYMDVIGEAIESVMPGFFSNELRVLDLCAAPGGKSTHLSTLLNDNSILIANEVIKSRSLILADNIAKWGRANVVVSNNDPEDFTCLDELFHLIVVDAPCSGEGMFTKDIAVIDEWSLDNVNLCSLRQKRILSDVWDALRPGGFLVYSTCTYNHFENDDNVKFIVEELGAEVINLDSFTEYGAIKSKMGGIQFVPGLVEGEGQFVALLRKDSIKDETSLFVNNITLYESNKGDKKRGKSVVGKRDGARDQRFPKGCSSLVIRNIPCVEGMVIEQKGELIKGYPAHLERGIKFFESKLKIILSGIAIANIKGNDFAPHADFALWQGVRDILDSGKKLPMGVICVEISREQAIDFLAKEPLVFSDLPKGYLMLSYIGMPLGFVKNLGNRTNSLLPMARRIRSKR